MRFQTDHCLNKTKSSDQRVKNILRELTPPAVILLHMDINEESVLQSNTMVHPMPELNMNHI